jgi:hypothetical protein
MKSKPSKLAEQWRLHAGQLASDRSDGNNGAFIVPIESHSVLAIISDGRGWDHVSVSTKDRCPTWEEMCFVKKLFFRNDETVIQLHPPSRLYIDHQRHTLHLWRHQKSEVALPPLNMI